MLRLTTSRSAYRRAGLVIGSAAAPTLLTLEEFEQLENESKIRLLEDPAIEHAVSEDGVKFTRVTAELRAEAVARYQEFMTGTGEEGGADSQTPLKPSLASDVAATTGDDAAQAATEAATPPSGEEQPAADAAPAPVAAPVPPAVEGAEAPSPSAGNPSGRAPKAAKPKASEAKAAS
ncbi:MAG: hypothetical protein H2047_16520 [Blastomonas sp.]|nr:hypothetical protein [Blastomonas sp.]